MTIHTNGREGVWHECCQCKCIMWTPTALNEAASRSRGKVEFFCPYGHGQVYAEGETEADKLRRERDRLAQQIAQRDDEIRRTREGWDAAERERAKLEKQMKQEHKRVSSGVCPCCTRSFQNLRRHIATKHPDYGAQVS
jgi:hypothetical protein